MRSYAIPSIPFLRIVLPPLARRIACALALASLASIQIAAGSDLDGRRTGVQSTGSYWGAAGEQIDLLSGNLNYTIPLLQARGRGSAGAAFALSYNSQIWRQSGGTPSLLGRDLGFGLGWTLQGATMRGHPKDSFPPPVA